MKEIVLSIEGMHCINCATTIEKALNERKGVKASVDFAKEKAVIEYDPDKIDVKGVVKIIQGAGFGVKNM